jgi:hypothetical protein
MRFCKNIRRKYQMKTKLLAAVSLIMALACSSLPSILLPDQRAQNSQPLYAISGTLNPAREITLPGNTRVLVMWMVLREDPGYIYFYGEGVLNFTNYAFEIDFDEPPPPEALNKFGGSLLGIGFVVLTANQKWDSKIDADDFPTADILGISANHAVIYVDGSFQNVPDAGWVNNFKPGFNVGRGVDLPEGFDQFEPVSPNEIQIIIDDFKNIKFLNWW